MIKDYIAIACICLTFVGLMSLEVKYKRGELGTCINNSLTRSGVHVR